MDCGAHGLGGLEQEALELGQRDVRPAVHRPQLGPCREELLLRPQHLLGGQPPHGKAVFQSKKGTERQCFREGLLWDQESPALAVSYQQVLDCPVDVAGVHVDPGLDLLVRHLMIMMDNKENPG